jgi:DNA-binding transcriptional ArsR family regulator
MTHRSVRPGCGPAVAGYNTLTQPLTVTGESDMLRLQPARCSRTLRVLADPLRLQLVRLLSDGPVTVGELAAALDRHVVKVSHHLGVLRRAGLVTPERDGRFVRYRLAPGVYTPGAGGDRGRLDLGCCTLEVPQE